LPVKFLSFSGEQYNKNIGKTELFFYFAAHFHAIHFWHHYIQENKPRIFILDNFQGLFSICCGEKTYITMVRRISAVARNLGLPADPSAVQTVQVSIDALARSDVTPFWRAVLGWVERDGPEDLMDPRGRGPALYFQQMDAPRPQRNRIHIDVYVPYDQAEARITGALAAGGRLVTDRFAPDWWVLADPEGNEACVATFGWIGPVPRWPA
jgi:hypothetical protein